MCYNIDIMKKQFIAFLLIFVFFYIRVSAADSEFLNSGINLYKNGEFELSRATLEEAKALNPKNWLIYFYLGNVYYQLNDLDNAIINYTTGLDLTEKRGVFFYNLGNCYSLKKNYYFSLEMYRKAVLFNPTLVDSYLNAGNSYYQAGNYENTIVQWETYLKKNPITPQYENIKKAIAYLKEELNKPKLPEKEIDKKTGLDLDLLNEIIGDLESVIDSTENVLENSEKPIDDLSSEDIER